MVDCYAFGEIVINQKKYTTDVIISKYEVLDNWWRQKGHELCVDDLKKFINEFKPSVVVVGTGKFGLMKIRAETKKYLEENNIRLIEERTSKAVNTFNKLLAENQTGLAAFHLTC